MREKDYWRQNTTRISIATSSIQVHLSTDALHPCKYVKQQVGYQHIEIERLATFLHKRIDVPVACIRFRGNHC